MDVYSYNDNIDEHLYIKQIENSIQFIFFIYYIDAYQCYLRRLDIVIDYDESSKILKVISDPRRLKIIDILSCGEQCACDILDHFDFTQPTLSHHMKVLEESGLINVRKDGLWSYYSLDKNKCNDILNLLSDVFNESDDCICKEINCICK